MYIWSRNKPIELPLIPNTTQSARQKWSVCLVACFHYVNESALDEIPVTWKTNITEANSWSKLMDGKSKWFGQQKNVDVIDILGFRWIRVLVNRISFVDFLYAMKLNRLSRNTVNWRNKTHDRRLGLFKNDSAVFHGLLACWKLVTESWAIQERCWRNCFLLRN